MTKTRETRGTSGVEVVMPREGGPEVLEVVEREVPGPGPGEVRVKVRASGVAFAEQQPVHPFAIDRVLRASEGNDMVFHICDGVSHRFP